MIKARFPIHKEAFKLNVDLEIPSTGITALYGASGCGKTSLLRAIAGLDRYPNAHLMVGERAWQDDQYFMPAHQRPIGYVFQDARLFSHLDVRGNLMYGVKRSAPSENRISLQHAIELLGIEKLLTRQPDTLSGGEQQRVAIARALAVNPQLLLMDEPLAALDQSRKQELLPYIESLHQELDIPVIYVSHSHEELARLADHLVLIEDGNASHHGRIHDMLTRLDLSLAHSEQAAAVIDAVVDHHDHEYQLSCLQFSGGQLIVKGIANPQGSCVRVHLAARDVSLTKSYQTDTSILNIFKAVVEQITDEGPSQVTIRLMAGETPLLSRITRKSATELGLQTGSKVYAQVKSVAVLK